MVDVLGSFYEELKTSNFIGGNEQVPFPRHDMSRIDWKVVAQLFVYGLQKHDYFPLFLSKCFLHYTIFGEENMTEILLIKGFLEFVSPEEKEILSKARIDLDDTEIQDVLDILSSYRCYTNPTKDNFESLLAEMSHLHIIQSPKYISNVFSEVLSLNASLCIPCYQLQKKSKKCMIRKHQHHERL